MKQIYLLCLAVILAACSAEPVENEGIQSLNANLAGKTFNARVNVDSEKENLDAPSILFVSNSDSTIDFSVVAGESGAPGGFDINWQLVQDPLATIDWESTCEMGFASNKNNAYNLSANGSYPLELGSLISSAECGESLICGLTYAVRVRAKNNGGKDSLKTSEWGEFMLSTAPCTECPAGYMIGNKNFAEIGTSKNWGWAHEFNFTENGSETREIHHKNGSLGGNVTIVYNNGMVTVIEGEGVNISHMYISDEEPTETNAPGQFDKTKQFEDADGSFWVIIKAEVCE